ncbi:carboxymuconolactone decarboxylase family protein [Streptomyces sp. SID13031]|uniref:carboxymuconolactone decarboxylase family protein n=1 Tax=Streptomyces sp. SID13031 TaxID=2706046 RepID=UPI0013C660E0|nr:carboxymuconolactone decarboxylase family protein [Streptomyces sp. SID13031]NEA34485.1 peroxidase [Streptomyces sp. SID13031]
MAFIRPSTPPAGFLENNRAPAGHIPNFVSMFASRPEVFEAWKQLNGAIKATMDLRRYELATLAAATALKSSYCSLAHGQVLADEFLTADEVASLVDAPAPDPVDRAVMTFARKVALAADTVTASDIDDLRALGLSDDDVLDITLAAAARAFFSKTLDATGTTPDAAFNGLPTPLRESLTVGRPIDS